MSAMFTQATPFYSAPPALRPVEVNEVYKFIVASTQCKIKSSVILPAHTKTLGAKSSN
jgi:hypothetical protein